METRKQTWPGSASICQYLASSELALPGGLDALLEEATTRCQATREAAEQADQRITAWMKEAEHEARSPFDYSNLDGEVAKVEDRADKQAGIARDAMVVATHAIHQAQVAILRAEVAIMRSCAIRKTAVGMARFRNDY